MATTTGTGRARGYELRERDFDSFFAAPFEAYGPASPFVSPLRSDLKRFLDPRRHPTFSTPEDLTFFSVLKDGRPLGRVVAHVHRAANRRHGLGRSQFGFFDCGDDLIAASLLMDAAEGFARRQAADEIAGNFNLTGNHAIGVVTEGFERQPYLEQTFNPPHVPRLLEALGYEPFFPMTTHEFEVRPDAQARAVERRRALPAGASAGGSEPSQGSELDRLRVVPVTRRTIRGALAACRTLLNDAFAANPLFVPMSEQEFDFYAKDLTWIVDPRITVLAYDGDRPVGAIVCVPDLNPFLRDVGSRLSPLAVWKFLRYRRACRRATIIYYAVDPAYQNRGVNGLMMHRLAEGLADAGYTHVGGTWIADVNPASLRQVEKIGARPYQRLHLYRRRLGAGALGTISGGASTTEEAHVARGAA
jgi:GNAT superfamily N-acetyltransferase